MRVPKFLRIAVVFSAAISVAVPTTVLGQQKKVDCGKPPEPLPAPKPSKGEKERKAKTKLQGKVAIEIDEQGDVVSAKAVQPSSGEAADQLVAAAKTMKFKPRPGCGTFKTVVNYSVGE